MAGRALHYAPNHGLTGKSYPSTCLGLYFPKPETRQE